MKKEKVTVSMAHYNTPELLPLAIALWRKQSVPVDIVIYDTGSKEKIDRFASEDVRIINFPKRNPLRHISEVIADACQHAQDNCETKHLMHTHVDVFPKSKYLLEYWISLMEHSPVVGYGMSNRSHTDPSALINTLWSDIVGHSLTMVDAEVMRNNKIEWSLQKAIDGYGVTLNSVVNWDTEVTFGLELQAKGIKPYFCGRDINYRLLSDKWHSHCRSYTTGKVYTEDYKGLLARYGLSLEVLQKEFQDELQRLKYMARTWGVKM